MLSAHVGARSALVRQTELEKTKGTSGLMGLATWTATDILLVRRQQHSGTVTSLQGHGVPDLPSFFDTLQSMSEFGQSAAHEG